MTPLNRTTTLRTVCGLPVLVDAADAERLTGLKLYRKTYPNTTYAQLDVVIDGELRRVSLHRYLLSPPDGLLVDHRNGDGLDCRRENLRVCTLADNIRNAAKPRTNCYRQPCRFAYKGARLRRPGSAAPWGAHVHVGRRQVALGNYATEELAARAHDTALMWLRGEFGRLNFADFRPVAGVLERLVRAGLTLRPHPTMYKRETLAALIAA